LSFGKQQVDCVVEKTIGMSFGDFFVALFQGVAGAVVS